MKIVTWNIRNCIRGNMNDGNNSFCFRAPLVRRVVSEELPDVMCFQEMKPDQTDWFEENFPDYIFLGCGRDKSLADDESMLVGLKRGTFRIIAMNTFWLSPTPEIPGSRHEDQSDCPRCATEVLVQHKESRQLYDILNTHLDHISSSARVLGSRAVLDHLKESMRNWAAFGDIRILLFGDFNAFPEDPEIRMVTEDGSLKDLTSGVGFTYHGFDPEHVQTKIDYIFASPSVSCSFAGRWTQEENGVFLSDHYPVCAVIDE